MKISFIKGGDAAAAAYSHIIIYGMDMVVQFQLDQLCLILFVSHFYFMLCFSSGDGETYGDDQEKKKEPEDMVPDPSLCVRLHVLI